MSAVEGILLFLLLAQLLGLAALAFRLRRALRATAGTLNRVQRKLSRLKPKLSRLKPESIGPALSEDLARFMDRSLWPQIESLITLYRIVDRKPALPATRRWSASPDFLLHLARHIERHAPASIIECGGGSSTLIMAHALRSFGLKGQIYTIENHGHFAEEIRRQAEHAGLDAYITVLPCPLVPQHFDGFDNAFYWYDLDIEKLPGAADMLVVDGPYGGFNCYARYPAGPHLIPRLSRNAHIFLDDADRKDEKALVKLWRQLYPDLGARTPSAEKGALELFFLDQKIEHYIPEHMRQLR